MPPTHNEVLSGFLNKKYEWNGQKFFVRFKYVLLISCFFNTAPAWSEGATIKPSSPKTTTKNNSSSETDRLLNGLPKGWNAHVIGVGKSRQSMKLPQSENKKQQDKNPSKIKENLHSNSVTPPPTTTSRHRILIPVSEDMGIAAYQSGNKFVFVIDNAHPMDISALRGDGIFSNLTVTSLPQVTIVTIPLPDTRRLFLSQQSEGWVLGDTPPPGNPYSDRHEIAPRITSAGLLFPMRKPGRIFSIKDPVSKEKLLIATSAFDDGGILSLRHGDHYDVWPSLEGVVVADHTPTQNIEMRRTENGALLNLGGEILPDIDQAVYANDVDLKWLGLRHLPVKDAETRYHNALLEAADSVPQERFEKRFEAAKAAFNVGDFLNARSIISVALDDDPEEAFRPDIRFFLGAISLLNGDIDEANLLDAQWPENDLRATQLWKGLYYAAIGKNNAEAAHLIANDFQRLLSYPDSLRPLILPMASEQIARYGTLEDMKALDSLPDEDNFSLARALRDLRIGKTDAAEKALTKLFNNQDPIIAEKAREAKISSDFSNNKLKPSEAVKKFSLLLPDARLAKREGIVRILQADAYMRDNQWENALSALDTVKHLTSQKADQRYTPMLHHILTNIARLPENTSHDPNDLNNLILHKAAILRAHLPELPAGPDKGDLLIAYGKMLSTLGLLDEASEVFSLAVPMMNTAVKKAEATNVLATSYLQRGKLDDASHILENSDNTSLPKSETAKRNRIIAQIAISSGKPEVALYLLNGDSDISAANLRAKIYEDRGEWPLAVQNVRQMAENLIPDKGNLTHSQQLLALRLASDASRAKDTATINWLIKKIDNRKFDNDTDHIFNLLVSPK